MANSSGWITLKQLVKELLLETGHDIALEKQWMQFAINGMKELHMFHISNVKTLKTTCNSVGIISFPSDYIGFIGLHMNYGGRLYPLTLASDMVYTLSDESNSVSLDTDIGEGVDLDTGGNYSYATLGGKNDYYYYLDEDNNRIIVKNSPTRTLFLQYISSGIDLTTGTGTFIPVKAVEALKSFILWRYHLRDILADKRLVQLYERDYNEQISKLRFFQLPTASELKDMIYETYANIRR